MKIICIRMNICSHGKENLLFLPSNMAAVQNLYSSCVHEENGGCSRTAVRVSSVIVYAEVLGRNAVPKNSYNFSKL